MTVERPIRDPEVGDVLTVASVPIGGRAHYRTGSAATWASVNPVLSLFEAGIETDDAPYAWKIGDGVTHYNDLGYQAHELPNLAYLRDAFAGVDAVNDALANIATAYDVAGGDLVWGTVEDWLFTLIGPEGARGPQGPVGQNANSLEWQYQAGFDNEPGQPSMSVRFDHPLVMASISNIYLSETSETDIDSTGWLNAIAAEGVSGYFQAVNSDDPTQFAILHIDNLPGNSGGIWHFEVSVVAVGNAFDDGSYLDISFATAGPQGVAGNDGSAGNDGIPVGILMQVERSDGSHTDSDPGNGIVRTNNATFGSITKLFVDDLEQNGGNVQPWFAAMGSVSNPVKGQLVIQSVDAGGGLAIFDVTAVTDAAGYTKLDVTPILNIGGMLVNGDSVSLAFSRSGNAA